MVGAELGLGLTLFIVFLVFIFNFYLSTVFTKIFIMVV